MNRQFLIRPSLALLFIGTLCVCGSNLSAAPLEANASEGSIHVTVTDERGRKVPMALIYLFDGQRIYLMHADPQGFLVLPEPPGAYRLFSASRVDSAESFRRYASPIAHIQLERLENVSVILKVLPVGDTEDPISVSTLRKMGLDPALADYLY